jgi:hypothetical protein
MHFTRDKGRIGTNEEADMNVARTLLTPVILAFVPVARFAAYLLMIPFALLALVGLIMARDSGEARDWVVTVGALLAVGSLRWFRASARRFEADFLAR